MSEIIERTIAGRDLRFLPDSTLGQRIAEIDQAQEWHKAAGGLLQKRQKELHQVEQTLDGFTGQADPVDVSAALATRDALVFVIGRLQREVKQTESGLQRARSSGSMLANSIAADLRQLARLNDPEENTGQAPNERQRTAARLAAGVKELTGVHPILKGKVKHDRPTRKPEPVS